jgi:5-methylcytosine-specific restriction endonuclease McrA
MLVQSKKVLVLNRSWRAIGVITLADALCKLHKEYNKGEPVARIIDPTSDFATFTWADWGNLKPNDGEDYIKSCGGAIFRVPEVIMFTRYDKLPTRTVTFSRRTIYARDHNTCQYCGKQPGTKELTIDHVKPKCQGGLSTWENCVLACVECNSRKADRTPQQAGMKLRKQPTKPKYNLFKGDYRVKSWESFLGAAYWETSLENDNQ